MTTFRKSALSGFCILVVLIIAQLAYERTDRWIRGASEQPYQLWMAALKGIGGVPYYVGSEGDYSYFRRGKIFCDRYKARTSKIRLPRTFPLDSETPYVVTFDMVPQYDAHPEVSAK